MTQGTGIFSPGQRVEYPATVVSTLSTRCAGSGGGEHPGCTLKVCGSSVVPACPDQLRLRGHVLAADGSYPALRVPVMPSFMCQMLGMPPHMCQVLGMPPHVCQVLGMSPACVLGAGGAPKCVSGAGDAPQELCRQRMATRPPDRPEGTHTSRISSVSSQFSDGPMPSPSARSSTSSWSEEPVQSNMDITTGHMILVSPTLALPPSSAHNTQRLRLTLGDGAMVAAPCLWGQRLTGRARSAGSPLNLDKQEYLPEILAVLPPGACSPRALPGV
ncbi:hypothetical protein P7K49_026071 [Saguinus oedipus]|uniref:Uncharacterized protein n=1 Tax=Saguinus oedipus TaxID=9490 RepID=A0ABQ9UIZ2_SAGOE|nr:hypothetical protein P7K49_026071 [Saguinus oedipus]